MTKRIAFVLVTVFLIAGIVISLITPGLSSSGGAVHFLGMTNDAVLGHCALVSINGRWTHQITLSSVSFETKTDHGWTPGDTSSRWRMAGVTNSSGPLSGLNAVSGPNVTLYWMNSGKKLRDLVVVVAEPETKLPWRVTAKGDRQPTKLAGRINELTLGLFDRVFGFGTFSATSREIAPGVQMPGEDNVRGGVENVTRPGR